MKWSREWGWKKREGEMKLSLKGRMVPRISSIIQWKGKLSCLFVWIGLGGYGGWEISWVGSPLFSVVWIAPTDWLHLPNRHRPFSLRSHHCICLIPAHPTRAAHAIPLLYRLPFTPFSPPTHSNIDLRDHAMGESNDLSHPPKQLLERLKDYGQEDVFALWDELSPHERDLLVKDIEVAPLQPPFC